MPFPPSSIPPHHPPSLLPELSPRLARPPCTSSTITPFRYLHPYRYLYLLLCTYYCYYYYYYGSSALRLLVQTQSTNTSTRLEHTNFGPLPLLRTTCSRFAWHRNSLCFPSSSYLGLHKTTVGTPAGPESGSIDVAQHQTRPTRRRRFANRSFERVLNALPVSDPFDFDASACSPYLSTKYQIPLPNTTTTTADIKW